MAGTKRTKFLLILVSLFLMVQTGKSQEVGFAFLAYPSPAFNLVLEPGMNGFGASFYYKMERFKKLNFSMSAEYAMTSWAHQGLIGLGINRTWVRWERFQINTLTHFLNGLSFHKPQPLYVFGVDTRLTGNFHIFQDLKIFGGIGIRYTLSPGYRQYGLIETSTDLPVEIGIKYVIGRFSSY
jgi:hypothetical protein